MNRTLPKVVALGLIFSAFSAGCVASIELLATPDAQQSGMPANPQVLNIWTP